MISNGRYIKLLSNSVEVLLVAARDNSPVSGV